MPLKLPLISWAESTVPDCLSSNYSSQNSSSRKTKLTHKWPLLGAMLPTYSFSPGTARNTDFKSCSLDSHGTIFPKSSFNVMPQPSLKIIIRKVLWDTVLHVVIYWGFYPVLLFKASVQASLYSIPPFLPWYVYPPTPERNNPTCDFFTLLGWEEKEKEKKTKNWKHISQCWREKQEPQEKRGFTANAKFLPAARLKTRGMPCTLMKGS